MAVAPPRPKGPPLNALRAFEASARLGGFKLAADELSVTPGAVAQHVKTLEDWAGARLFERHAQGVILTPLGQAVVEDFSAAFDKLAEAAQNLRIRAAPGVVRIATLPSIAQLWLSPRLPALRRRRPGLSVSVTAMEHQPNLARDDFDATLFFEDFPLARGGISLARDCIFPVCAPALARDINSVDDLRKLAFLQDTTWAGDWQAWLAAAAPARPIASAGPAYSLYALAVEEAVNGAGVLIGHESLVERHLAAGTLVAPFGEKVMLDRALVLRTSRPASARPDMKAFVDGLTG